MWLLSKRFATWRDLKHAYSTNPTNWTSTGHQPDCLHGLRNIAALRFSSFVIFLTVFDHMKINLKNFQRGITQ